MQTQSVLPYLGLTLLFLVSIIIPVLLAVDEQREKRRKEREGKEKNQRKREHELTQPLYYGRAERDAAMNRRGI